MLTLSLVESLFFIFLNMTLKCGIDFGGFFFNISTLTRGIHFVGFCWLRTLERGNNVGGDPNTWLETVGLAEYKSNFRRNHIKTVRDMEALKSFTEKEIREDLHITKPGTAHD